MKAYQVQSTNMDREDGVFEHGNFFQMKHAVDVIKAYAYLHQGCNVVEDLEGSLEKYNDRSSKYSMWNNRPKVYYQSHWGSYNMVIWIREIHIQE